MTFVKHPNFVTKDSRGALTEIRCKVCGTPIAGLTEKVEGTRIDRNGNRIETKVRQWARHHNFTELKIGFQDGTAHITTGCNQCLTPSISPDQLHELHIADMNEQEPDLGMKLATQLRARIPQALVGIKLGGGIL